LLRACTRHVPSSLQMLTGVALSRRLWLRRGCTGSWHGRSGEWSSGTHESESDHALTLAHLYTSTLRGLLVYRTTFDLCVEATRNEHEADSGVHSHLGVHAERGALLSTW